MVDNISTQSSIVSDYADRSAAQNQQQAVSKLQAKIGNIRTPQEARKVAKEFEAVFLSQVMQYMFAGISSDTLFGGGQAENVYRSFMNDEYGKILSERGGLGIADEVYKEIMALQQSSIRSSVGEDQTASQENASATSASTTTSPKNVLAKNASDAYSNTDLLR